MEMGGGGVTTTLLAGGGVRGLGVGEEGACAGAGGGVPGFFSGLLFCTWMETDRQRERENEGCFAGTPLHLLREVLLHPYGNKLALHSPPTF